MLHLVSAWILFCRLACVFDGQSLCIVVFDGRDEFIEVFVVVLVVFDEVVDVDGIDCLSLGGIRSREGSQVAVVAGVVRDNGTLGYDVGDNCATGYDFNLSTLAMGFAIHFCVPLGEHIFHWGPFSVSAECWLELGAAAVQGEGHGEGSFFVVFVCWICFEGCSKYFCALEWYKMMFWKSFHGRKKGGGGVSLYLN